jgi:hypothetical protein
MHGEHYSWIVGAIPLVVSCSYVALFIEPFFSNGTRFNKLSSSNSWWFIKIGSSEIWFIENGSSKIWFIEIGSSKIWFIEIGSLEIVFGR